MSTMSDDQKSKYETKKVFVPIQDPCITKDILMNVFRNYDVKDIIHKSSFAIVTFITKESAENAIKDITNKPPLNLSLAFARKKEFYDSKSDGKDSKHSSDERNSTNNYQKEKKNQPRDNANRYDRPRKTNRYDQPRDTNNRYEHPKDNNRYEQQGQKERKFFNRKEDKPSYNSTDRSSSGGMFNKKPPYKKTTPHSNSSNPLENVQQHFRQVSSSAQDVILQSNMSLKDYLLGFNKCILQDFSNQNKEVQNKGEFIDKLSELLDTLTLSEESFEPSSPSSHNISSEDLLSPKTPTQPVMKDLSPNTVTPSREWSAWLCGMDSSMTLKMVRRCDSGSGIIALAMDTSNPSMLADYRALFDDLAASCSSAPPMSGAPPLSGVVCVESQGAWYRAVQCRGGWALLDEGTSLTEDKVTAITECPDRYKSIPVFTCLFKPEMDVSDVNLEADYSFKVVSKNSKNNTIVAKVTQDEGAVSMTGIISQWEPTPQHKQSTLQDVPSVSPRAPTVKSSVPERTSIIDTVKPGDKMELTFIVSESLGQVCIMLNREDSALMDMYNSLIDEFAQACEREQATPATSERVMAVHLKADNAWYRSVLVQGGWALLDEGHTVSLDKVISSTQCPLKFFKVPEFCVLLTNALPLKTQQFYSVDILSKTNNKAKVKITHNKTEITGFISPFAEFRSEQTTAELLEEKVKNCMIMNSVKVDCLTKLNVRSGSNVVIVHYDKEKVYLMLNNDNAKRNYFDLLDKLTLAGAKLDAISGTPEKEDIVVCKYKQQYHRAIVDKYNSLTGKCDLTFVDVGCRDSISKSELRVVPVWATEIPIMTDSFKLIGVDTSLDHPSITTYLALLTEKQIPLKCVELSLDQVDLEIEQNKQNLNKKLIDMVTPNWKKIVSRDEVILEPVIMEQDAKYIRIKSGDRIKLLHILDLALSVTVVDSNLEEQLKEMTKQFSEYCNATEPYLPRADEVCFYWDEESGSWRRGLAITVDDGDTLALASLDYGSAVHVKFSKCRKMLKEFVDPLPFLAVYATISDIGENPSESTFNKMCQVLKNMHGDLVAEKVSSRALGIYDIKIKGLAPTLRDQSIL